MKKLFRIFAPLGALIAFSIGSLFAQDAQPAAPATPENNPSSVVDTQTVTTTATATTAVSATTAPVSKKTTIRIGGRNRGNEMVSVFSDVVVNPGQSVRSAVAIIGGVRVDGEAREAVAILGPVTTNTKVNQTVSIAGSTTVNAGSNECGAVVGNVYVNSHVTGNVVAVCGGVELGPDARVDGDVVALGGGLKRADTASIGGQVVQFKVFSNLSGFDAWLTKGLYEKRLLGFGPGLLWAWCIAGVFLLVYLFTALLFPKTVNKCAESLELHPGAVFLTAIITVVAKPIISLLLAATGVGAILLVFVLPALAILAKTTFLAWLGRRITLHMGVTHPVLAVFIGGALLALLYCVPFFAFFMWKFSSFLGMGAVIYTCILALRRRRAERAATLAAAKAARDAANPNPTPAPETALITAQTSAVLAPRAGFWIRAGALLIDFLMIAVVAKMCHVSVLMLPVFAIYCIVMWALRGTTIGGIVCGLKIVRLDDRPVDWATAIVRALSGFISMFPAGLGFIWVAFDSDNQSWHDKIAGTVVVHAPKGQSLV